MEVVKKQLYLDVRVASRRFSEPRGVSGGWRAVRTTFSACGRQGNTALHTPDARISASNHVEHQVAWLDLRDAAAEACRAGRFKAILTGRGRQRAQLESST